MRGSDSQSLSIRCYQRAARAQERNLFATAERPGRPALAGPMRLWHNFFYWSAIGWAATLVLYDFKWSELNASLDPQLRLFLIVAIVASLLLGIEYASHPLPDRRDVTEPARRPWVTVAIVCGFAADFAYRGGIPLLSGEYQGYDVAAEVQATVGIPVVHVALVAGAIFYSIVLAQQFALWGGRRYAWEFVALQLMLLLNYSRGYIAFSTLGAIVVIIATRRRGRRAGRSPVRRVVLAVVAGYALLVGVGMFGNYRSGDSWFDSSHISRIGYFNDAYPDFLSPHLKWAYTYLTSPLANLNYNFTQYPGSGSPSGVSLAFLPQTFTKYFVADRLDVAYQVRHLNASTGWIEPYYLGGGVVGLYLALGLQLVILRLGAFVVRRSQEDAALYGAVATVVVIAFLFFNSYANTATCFLLPLAVAVSIYRRRRRLRATSRASSIRAAGPRTPSPASHPA